ncbi:hypothetical protein [Terribacillus halophilus]|uniref:hypothetical protein n=1 Tax=Terribacillus halophilus TaxID=361279 RepID=UPI000B8292A1|nr:hypothetical protein [Terribacillus halophilus]
MRSAIFDRRFLFLSIIALSFQVGALLLAVYEKDSFVVLLIIGITLSALSVKRGIDYYKSQKTSA